MTLKVLNELSIEQIQKPDPSSEVAASSDASVGSTFSQVETSLQYSPEASLVLFKECKFLSELLLCRLNLDFCFPLGSDVGLFTLVD